MLSTESSISILWLSSLSFILSLIAGLVVAGVIRNTRQALAIKMAFQSIARLRTKEKTKKQLVDLLYLRKDEQFSELRQLEKRCMADQETIHVLEFFAHSLEVLLKEHLEGVYLFGSRSRGDNSPDSDIDVAVFVSNIGDHRTKTLFAVFISSYQILMNFGLYTQPKILDKSVLKEPNKFTGDRLARAIHSQGIQIL